MNALEKYRTENGLTFEGLGIKAGVKLRGTVFKHCTAERIPGDAALVYHKALGIPLAELRPDIYAPAQPETSSQPGNGSPNLPGEAA